VGKTALLRQVLTDPRFHVVHFDLRIAGFADVTSLYMSLAAQFEHFFESLATELEGYDEMKKHGLTFKHAWLDWEKRMSKPENQLKVHSSLTGVNKVSVADVAGLMEKFQVYRSGARTHGRARYYNTGITSRSRRGRRRKALLDRTMMNRLNGR
jgi:hypothetical protein